MFVVGAFVVHGAEASAAGDTPALGGGYAVVTLFSLLASVVVLDGPSAIALG